MHYKLAATAVAAVTTVGAGGFAVAIQSAQAAPGHAAHAAAASPKEYFLLTSGPGDKQVVVAHGAFVGGGRDVSHANKDVLSLGGGTLSLFHPQKTSHFSDKFNRKTCFDAFTGTGTYTLGSGTGTYKGVTGSGSFHYVGQAIAKRTGNGSCDQKSAPKVEVTYIRASGPVSMP